MTLSIEWFTGVIDSPEYSVGRQVPSEPRMLQDVSPMPTRKRKKANASTTTTTMERMWESAFTSSVKNFKICINSRLPHPELLLTPYLESKMYTLFLTLT